MRPRILIVDDQFGRGGEEGERDRRYLAHALGLCVAGGEQADGDEVVAEATFLRGQHPSSAVAGDVVENDLDGVVARCLKGWVDVGGRARPWALVLLDLRFYTGLVTEQSNMESPGMPEGRPEDDTSAGYFGLKVLRRLREVAPHVPVMLLSSKDRTPVAEEYAELGAYGFIGRTEPDAAERLRYAIRRHGLYPDESGTLVGSSPALLLALREARRVAGYRKNVLIRGERGTGKELFARFINQNESGERHLTVVDSGALSPNLYASELFGHRRGAFTGASADRIGRVQQADGGTLFLDEIGNMPTEVQVALLRLVEARVLTPVGAINGKKVDVRFLSATNEELERATQSGAFRADLLDRLREGGEITLPPLRLRLADIPDLVEYFVRAAEDGVEGAARREITGRALESLEAGYDWPGNVRELKQIVTQAVLRHPYLEYLTPDHLVLPRTQGSAVGSGLSKKATVVEMLREVAEESKRACDQRSWAGALPVVQRELASIMSSLLLNALRVTKDPNGHVQLQPAGRLLTGDETMTTTQAADLIKRICDNAMADNDPLLREALDRSCRLRSQRQPRRSRSE